MDNFALRKKRFIFCIHILTSLSNATTTAISTTLNEKSTTHLEPLIVTGTVDKNAINQNNRQSQLLVDDTSVDESIKIENRQLYDTVKHASGYDPDMNNNSRYAIKELEGKSNNSSALTTTTTTATVRILPRKSAVIQAIPRKVRGPGGSTLLPTTPSMLPFTKSQSSALTSTAKDYGAGEPTTTIVYATSIPTSMPSRTFVNIRPVPLLSTQKYRSTVVIDNNERENHHKDVENPKPVVEHHPYQNDEQSNEDDDNTDDNQERKLLVFKKPTTAYRVDSNSMQSTTTPTTNDQNPSSYQIDQQQKKNPYKSLPYSRIRTNEELNDGVPSNNRQDFYSNHKWGPSGDYMQRGSQLPPSLPLNPPSTHFVYENPDSRRDYFHRPPPHQPQTQNFPSPRYIAMEGYHHNEMYNTDYSPMTQQEPMHGLLSQQQQQYQQQQQQYQPLTVRDFDLLLQLLVLRERRLHACQDPYLSPNDFNCANIQQDNSFIYNSPKPSPPPPQSLHEYPYIKNRESFKHIENFLPRTQQQPATSKLLPSNIREELLFRMLLLALHLQPQPNSQSQFQPKPSTHHQHHQNIYLGPPMSLVVGDSTSSSGAGPSPYLGFRQAYRSTTSKNPIRSVQVLGEID
ncbi:uncharacterized protein LOC129920688 [Episyrphus balteatus]|uniref:uncharacterized protein LOC129920688 n=1 Tax=Episyrphus balteatus TaxID=286459 RepID=UPI002485F7F8|nr:uncharacterized protein LOC129920688 [Episyrphus balteatus]